MAGLTALPFALVARQILLLLIFSLAFMQPEIYLLGFAAVPADFIFLALAAAWAGAVATGQVRIGWNDIFLAVFLYFLAMLLSLAAADDPERSGAKLLTQLYLLSLPFVTSSLIGEEKDLQRALRWWLAGSAVVIAAAMLTLLLFVLDPASPLLGITLNEFGTLPPGAYPRLRVTFMYASMLCNYLSVSVLILLAMRYRGWIAARPFAALLAGLLVTAFLSLSPGFAGIVLPLGLWFWLSCRPERPNLAMAALAIGLAGAILLIPVMSFTPDLHRTAPFLVTVPGSELTLAPSVRLMVWTDAVRNFLAEPLLGRGIGADAVRVWFVVPEGELKLLTDAHNSFLNLAVQCGTPGLAAFLFLLWTVARRTLPLQLGRAGGHALSLALGLGFLLAMAYQGLGGSFEDARHLWVLLGLFVAADRIERNAAAIRPPSPDAVPAHS